MRILVVGATGVIGRRLVPSLISDGHDVIGTTPRPDNTDPIRAADATPAVVDLLDRDAVEDTLAWAAPDVVVHQATALAGFTDFRRFDEAFSLTNRLRSEGTDHLIEGMRRLHIQRIVAQSFAGPGAFSRTGGFVKTEDDPLDPDPPEGLRRTVAAIRHLEQAVLHTDGVHGTVLRYGSLYGPDTSLGEGGAYLEAVRRRRFPVVGKGTGVSSFLHVDDAVSATRAAIEGSIVGLYNVVDDDPAPVADWLPALANAIGAKPPRKAPEWLARLFVGEHGVVMMTESRGASNVKARRELNWRPTYASWRDGFRRGLGDVGSSEAA